MSSNEKLAGEIYDLCNLALSELDRWQDGLNINGLKILVTEIQTRNTQVYDAALRDEFIREATCDG